MTNPKIQKLAQYIFNENIPIHLANVYKDNFSYSFVDDFNEIVFTSQGYGKGLIFYYTSPDQSVLRTSLPEEDLIFLHQELAKLYLDYFDLKDHNIDRDYELGPVNTTRLEPDPIWLIAKN